MVQQNLQSTVNSPLNKEEFVLFVKRFYQHNNNSTSCLGFASINAVKDMNHELEGTRL